MFFVLSGYLITRLLVDERDRTGRIDLGRFYLRRLARLYPAVIVLVVACAPWWRELGDPWHGYWLTAALPLTYTQNVYMWVKHDGGGALSHTWSLAVEEQFYLLWPAAVMLARGRRRNLLVVCVVGSVASVASLIAGSHGVPSALAPMYFAPQGRAFELLAGCALAIARRTIPRKRASVVGGAGLAALAAVILSSESVGRGEHLWVLLVAAGGAGVAIVAAVVSGSTLGLTGSAVRWLGCRSYGAYLYHLPLVAAVDAVGVPTWATFPTVFAATLAACALSWRWVEKPVQELARARLTRASAAAPVPVAATS